MSGVSAIWYLLAHNSAVLAVVPASRITAGNLPLGTTLPAISIKQISSVPFNLLHTNEASKMHQDRVQVSVLFKGPQGSPAGTGYIGVKALMRLVLAACPSQRGAVNNITVDSIVPESEGPDLYDQETDIHEASRDFLVRWIST